MPMPKDILIWRVVWILTILNIDMLEINSVLEAISMVHIERTKPLMDAAILTAVRHLFVRIAVASVWAAILSRVVKKGAIWLKRDLPLIKK